MLVATASPSHRLYLMWTPRYTLLRSGNTSSQQTWLVYCTGFLSLSLWLHEILWSCHTIPRCTSICMVCHGHARLQDGPRRTHEPSAWWPALYWRKESYLKSQMTCIVVKNFWVNSYWTGRKFYRPSTSVIFAFSHPIIDPQSTTTLGRV